MENETITTAPNADFYKALAAAQAEFAPVIKNRVNPAFHSKYADLQAIFDSCRPALNRHGFFLYQKVTSDANSVSVETCLSHESGQTLSSGLLTVPYSTTGNRGANPAQAFGSARTYACRYSISSFLCIAADDDDDGNGVAAKQAPAPAPQPQLRPIQIDEGLAIRAREAAQQGTLNFREYWKSLPDKDKKSLTAAKMINSLQAVAKEADAKIKEPEHG